MALATVVVVACAAAIGQWIAVLAGRQEWVWWAPGVGCAAILAVAGLLIRAPGHAVTVALALIALTLLALASKAVRTALVAALPEGLPLTLITVAAGLLPYAVSGRTGVPGVGDNNDMSAHLTTAWWLQHRMGSDGIGAVGGALTDVGYPLGPHGLAAALSLGHVSLVHAFNAVILLPAPLTALAALGALPPGRRLVRLAAAVLVGLCYLAASYMVQAAFKETFEAMVLIATALVARDLVDRRLSGWRAGLPLGVLVAGAVHIYSYPGVAWPLLAVAGVALIGRRWRPVVRSIPGALLAVALLVAPATKQIIDFYNSPFAGENNNGNLVHPILPLQGLGVWLNPDFRFNPHPVWPSIALGCVAAAGLLVALWRLLRRRDLALPAALVSSVILYVYATATKSMYVSAKTLAVLAPLAMVTIAAGLLGGRSRLPIRALVLVIGVAAAASTFLALRDGRVAPTTYAQELATLRPKLGHHSTLFMGRDDFAQWELHGATLGLARQLYAPIRVFPRPDTQSADEDATDFDSFTAQQLDGFYYVITTNAPYGSSAPPNFHVVASTPSFLLWKRSGHTPVRSPVDPPGAPGATLDCGSAFGRQRLAEAGPNGTAGVLPPPVVVTRADWHGQPRNAGDSATATVLLGRGAWDLSMQYVSNTGLDVRAGHLRGSLPASLDRLGPYFRVGTVRVRHAGPVTVRVTARPMNRLGRLLGAPGFTWALNSPGELPLNQLAFTRHGARERVVPVRQACGRYVDWVAPAVAGS
jgi:hypothetical protein